MAVKSSVKFAFVVLMMLLVVFHSVEVEGKALGSKGSLLVQIKCNKTSDCKDPKCVCADLNLCFCNKAPKLVTFNAQNLAVLVEPEEKKGGGGAAGRKN